MTSKKLSFKINRIFYSLFNFISDLIFPTEQIFLFTSFFAIPQKTQRSTKDHKEIFYVNYEELKSKAEKFFTLPYVNLFQDLSFTLHFSLFTFHSSLFTYFSILTLPAPLYECISPLYIASALIGPIRKTPGLTARSA